MPSSLWLYFCLASTVLGLGHSFAFHSISIRTSEGFSTQLPGLVSQSVRFRRCDARFWADHTKMVVSELIGDFNVGDRVKVAKSSITLFTVKDYPNGYLVPKGAEGQIIKVITMDIKSGKPVSPNRPLLVKFENPKFQAHFEARELERVL